MLAQGFTGQVTIIIVTHLIFFFVFKFQVEALCLMGF